MRRHVGRPQTTRVLVENALAGGGYFTFSALVERVWPAGDQPKTAIVCVRNIVARLKTDGLVETQRLNRRTIVRLIDPPHNAPAPAPAPTYADYADLFESDEDAETVDFEFD